MIINKVIKLKKYLFLISILFLVLLKSHLIYIYLYSDSKLIPIKGGVVSEWLIWNFPSLNPLKTLSWNNKYIVDLLYRAPLRYDLKQDKIVWNLANCDLSSLTNIECYIKQWSKWSSWEDITVKDIESTYNIIKETNSNKIIASLLKDTEIITDWDRIIFKNPNQDINFLNIFFQPIVSKKIINNLTQEQIYWNFPTTNQIYSGNFSISNISSDLTLGFSKITLDKNTYNEDLNISKLILKIFPNTASFLKNKETVNVFNDDYNIIWESIPRFQSYKYILPQFVSLFINQTNVENSDIRGQILWAINSDSLIEELWVENFQKVHNPYLSEHNMTSSSLDNISTIMKKEWYVKKYDILTQYTKTDKKYSEEVNVDIEIKEDEIKIDDFQEKSKYITSPSYVDKYNFITLDDILLTWNTPSSVEKVFINDYELSNFKEWNTKFYYRLKESYDSIEQWENNYKIYFQEDWKKVLKEELNFLYYTDKDELEREKINFITNLVRAKKKKEVKVVEKVEVNKEDLNKLSLLDENLYYNNKLEPYKLVLMYLNSSTELEKSAIFVKESLYKIWIDTEIIPIWLKDLSNILWEKEQYDIIITWVNLWYFNYNIFPYFHSSQSKNWYNFSNIKKTSLDLKLEELKSTNQAEENFLKIEKEVIDILDDEQIIKMLYTPKINLLIDKNIKNVEIPEKIPNKSLRSIVFESSYTQEEKIINFENKSIKGFFYFLYKKINE